MDTSVRRLAAGTLLAAFDGTTAPSWVLRSLEDGLGGVTLFGFNVHDHAQLAGLTARLRNAGDPVVSLDEEGGDVTRLAYHVGSSYPGNAALGAVDDVVLTHDVYRAIGTELIECGVTLDMAPDADINVADDNPVIGTRSFGNDPALVARHTAAAVRGLQSVAVAACVKHFPGHGATTVDSHLAIPVVDVSPDVLRARELVPFVAAIEAGARSIMTAHVAVPALTGDTPATLSAAALTTLLRDELGYDGVVVSDALDMHAITGSVGLTRGAVASLAAGSDLLCLGPLPGPDEVRAIVGEIVAATRDGRLPVARLEQAAARVADLRSWSGSPTSTPLTRPIVDLDTIRHADPDPARRVVGLDAARRAVRLSGAVGPLVDPLVVEIDTPPNIAAGNVPWGVAPWLPQAEVVRTRPGDADPEALLGRAQDRSLVVVLKDGHRFADSRALVSALVAARPDTVVIELGLPVWRPDSAAYIATYGAARANTQAAVELLTA